PPAIISTFIGAQLTQLLNLIDKSTKKVRINSDSESGLLRNFPKIPEILLDNTDRNRTSPFAFTGNKFEFRAVGSSQTCAPAMITINLIVADQLKKFKAEVDSLIEKKVRKDDAIFQVVKRYIGESKNIRFEGNNYGEDWVQEAARRKLSNLRTTPEAVKAFVSQKTEKLFEENQVLTKRELEARFEIRLEHYTKKIQIESRVLGDLSTNHIIPIAIKYQNTLIENVKGLKQVLDYQTYGKLSHNQMETITEISEHVDKIKTFVHNMVEERKKANRIDEVEAKAIAYCQNVFPYFDKIRYHVDKLEMLVDDNLWPLPKYRELLFMR
ncbi:MAG: glutamine synthetase type III, partial [Bacteroidales bacterium]|nr:glutamine synthetase type III [Bacteroidales bacterium]